MRPRATPSGLIGARRRGAFVDIEVWDSGIGIAGHDIENAFKPYHQLASGDGTGSGGLGFGLSIVRSPGDMLGHPVSVRSRPGRGSVFRIRVPLAQAAPDAVPASRDPAPVPDAAHPEPQAAHILEIDDDAELLDLLGMMLAGGGYTVTLAPDEAAAMAAIKAQPIDLIVSDFRLRGTQDGLDVARMLRALLLETQGRTVPVIMLAGDIAIETLMRFAAEDCTRPSKPVRPEILLVAIAAPLRQALPVPVLAGERLVHVIDDDPVLLSAWLAMLADAALPARLHGSSEAFRASWSSEDTGCLLIDAYLPGESGLALLHSLQAAGTLPPAIIITGQSMWSHGRQGRPGCCPVPGPWAGRSNQRWIS
jgi:two-component system CheB/CheR fusion protein